MKIREYPVKDIQTFHPRDTVHTAVLHHTDNWAHFKQDSAECTVSAWEQRHKSDTWLAANLQAVGVIWVLSPCCQSSLSSLTEASVVPPSVSSIWLMVTPVIIHYSSHYISILNCIINCICWQWEHKNIPLYQNLKVDNFFRLAFGYSFQKSLLQPSDLSFKLYHLLHLFAWEGV